MMLKSYSAAAVSLATSTERFTSLKDSIGQISNQLSTGKVSRTYAGLGTAAGASVSLRFRLSGLQDTASAIDAGSLRLTLMNASLSQISKVATDLPTAVSKIRNNPNGVLTSATDTARQGLDAVVQALNEQLNGQYLFAGRASDTRPVASTEEILNGDATRAGLETLVSERQAADVGTGGMGRLVLNGSGSPVTLSEESATNPFGLKLQAASATGTGVTATRGGSPVAVSFSVGAQPAPGDALSLTLGLPDGTTSDIKLIAGSVGAEGAVSYRIGATTAETAESIRQALQTAVTALTATDLPAASAMQTAKQFFAADATTPPARVAGPPFATATALRPGTAADTVVWYTGDNGSSPRSSSVVRISERQTIGIGAAANEAGFQSVLANFGALAASALTGTDAQTRARYGALADRVSANLGTSQARQQIATVAEDLALASSTMKSAKQTGTITQEQIKDALSGIEDTDTTEAATRLLATQTRLQASYQVTATIMKLSLTDYL